MKQCCFVGDFNGDGKAWPGLRWILQCGGTQTLACISHQLGGKTSPGKSIHTEISPLRFGRDDKGERVLPGRVVAPEDGFAVPHISLVFREMWDSTALALHLPQQNGLFLRIDTSHAPHEPTKKVDEEPGCGGKVVNHDADVLHPLDRHVLYGTNPGICGTD